MKLKREPGFLVNSLLDVSGGISAFIVLFTMMAVIYEVVMRYFLGRPTIWVLEVVEWCLVWMTFLSAAWILKEDGHVTMDIVVSRFNLKTQALIGIITSLVGALICLTFAWYGTKVVWDHIARGVVEAKMLRAPKGPLLAVIPTGFFLLFIQFLRRSRGFLKKFKAS